MQICRMAKQAMTILTILATVVVVKAHTQGGDSSTALTDMHGVRITPHLSTALALGGSTGDAEFLEESGHHDPHYDGFNMQAFELGGGVEFGEDFSVFAIYNLQWDREEKWDGHWEEAYMDFRIHPALTIRSGIQLVNFGRENNLHVHERDFVQASLATTRFLGEDGLILSGASFTHTWGDDDQHSLTFGLGSVFELEHGHSEEEHEEEHEEAAMHAEDAYLSGNTVHARWQSNFSPWTVGVSGVVGENHWERTTYIVGADVSRRLRIAGKSATVAAEWSYRHVDGYEEESEAEASFDETALSVSFAYDVAEDWEWHNRVEWLSGAEIAGLDERVRFSTNMSHFFCWNQLHHTLRLQYDADFLPGVEVENSVWLQFVIEWGEGH